MSEIPAPPAAEVPTAVLSGGVDRGLPELPDPSDLDEAVAPPAGPLTVAAEVPEVISQPALVAPLLAPVTAAPAAPPAVSIAAPPPAAPPPAREGQPVSGASEARGLGSSSSIPDADLAAAAARAMPGLVAILGLTALGGVLGYRQAKAGHMLRAAGAARFLQ